jgi:hypothetical protein
MEASSYNVLPRDRNMDERTAATFQSVVSRLSSWRKMQKCASCVYIVINH